MRHEHGGDIYSQHIDTDYSININPFGPGRQVLEAAIESLASMDCYPDGQCRKLRQALAQMLKVPEENFVFGNGATDIIFSLVYAKRPKRALVTAPAFAEYGRALQAVGCEMLYHPLWEEESFAVGERYLQELEDGLDMIFLCSPDNPTGKIVERQLLLRILKRCEELGILMVLDESFYEFAKRPMDCTMQAFVSGHPQLFLLRAFTKMYAMAGLRLGYGMTSNIRLLEQMEEVMQPWSVSSVAQAAAVAALNDRDRVQMTREYIRKERNWMEHKLKEIGVCFFASAVNYMLLKSPYDLAEILRKEGLLIRDCSNYEGLGPGYYRIAVKTRKENEKLMDALAAIYSQERGERWKW